MPPKKRRQYRTGSLFQRKDGLWVGVVQAGWTENGTRRRLTVSGKTETICKAKLAKKVREVDDQGPPPQSERVTVKAWAETWLDNITTGVRPKTWAGHRSSVKKWIIPAIGHKRLALLTPGDMKAVTDPVRAANTTSTALRVHAILCKMLRDAQEAGHRVPDHVLKTKRPKASVSDRGAIDLGDALALLDAASSRPDGSRWVAALLQGMRQGECLGLQWSCVDLETGFTDVSWQLQTLPYLNGRSGSPRIPDGYEYKRLDGALCLVRPKTEKGQRLIPLVPWMVTALRAWAETQTGPNPHGLVWPRPDGKPQRATDDRAAWHDLQDAARVAKVDGIKGRRYLLHECRHTAATLLQQDGADEETRKRILGHSKTVAAYIHVDQTQTRLALERLAERLQLN